MQVLSSLSGITFYAPSAGFAPTNSADVSAIASSYQVVSATATQLYAGTAYVTSVNDNPLSASRAGNAANASLATSAYYDGTGRLISSLPDSATVSAIASSYAESAASSKQDTLTFGYDDDDKISSINGSSLAGEGGGLVTALGTGLNPWYEHSVSSINGMDLSARWAVSAENASAANSATSATYAQTANYAKTVAPSAISAYISAVTSPSGTIVVTNRTGIDATDSAVVGEYIPGYSGISTYAGNLVPFNGVGSAVFTGIPDSLPVTASLAMKYGAPDTITFSGSNGTTASASYAGSPTALTADIGKVSSVYIYTQHDYIEQDGLTYTADAVDNASIVALAHASALPTYQYNAEDKISSINGSALAGGGGGEADWSAESGQPGYIENKPVPKTLVAGAGITITENSTELVVASTNTLYTAGSGLTLNGTTFAVDPTAVQGKLTYDYDASGNISGIDGSALVGGDPEATDLYVQSPLYTGVSGGSAYIGWNNETVLYSDFTGRPTNTGGTISLNESPLNFQYVEVYLNGVSAISTSAGWANSYQKIDTVTLSSVPGLTFVGLLSGNTTWWDVGCAYAGVSGTTWTKVLGYTKQVNSTAAGMMDNVNHLNIWKVVGINRTAGE